MRGLLILAAFALVLWQGSAHADALTDVKEGNTAFKSGQYQLAIDAFGRAITSGELDPEALAITYNNRGVALGEIGDTDRAIEDYSKALTLSPKDETTLRNLRVAYLKRGMDYIKENSAEKARADFDSAIATDPTHPAAYIKRAQLNAEEGDLDGALADYKAALARDPENADLKRVVGQLEAAMSAPAATPTASNSPPAIPESSMAQTTTDAESAAASVPTAPVAADRGVDDAATTGGDTARTEPESTASTAAEQAVAPADSGNGDIYRTISAVYFRAGPSNDDARVGAVDGNVKVRVIGEKLGWKRVVLPNGQEGYIYKKWLEPVAE
ncbi:MAG: tetratricopeptide repeat protein [Geminicoccaceae bacterium]|nr:tetratricopeptide repeat protein [Geminicoccaceae bacterium]